MSKKFCPKNQRQNPKKSGKCTFVGLFQRANKLEKKFPLHQGARSCRAAFGTTSSIVQKFGDFEELWSKQNSSKFIKIQHVCLNYPCWKHAKIQQNVQLFVGVLWNSHAWFFLSPIMAKVAPGGPCGGHQVPLWPWWVIKKIKHAYPDKQLKTPNFLFPLLILIKINQCWWLLWYWCWCWCSYWCSPLVTL